MTHRTPIDHRPFQAKAALAGQQALEDQYRRIAIDEVAAALFHLKSAADAMRRHAVADAA